MVKILSWNVNGLRAIIAKGMIAEIEREAPDAVCLQEIKVGRGFVADGADASDQVSPAAPSERIISALPYQFFSPAARPGYAGTAVLSRTAPLGWRRGIGSRVSDDEGRVTTVEFPSLYLVSVYVPNSQRGLPRLGLRLRWDTVFRSYVQELSSRKPVVFCGDMNVAHQEIDIARPEANRMNPGFTDRERRSFGRLLAGHPAVRSARLAPAAADGAFIDTFRLLHPDAADRYSWWSYATRARERNIGWRIDYVCVSPPLAPRLREAFILDGIQGSDHCPVGAVLEGEL
jgi:exodeoxyribonuclease III